MDKIFITILAWLACVLVVSLAMAFIKKAWIKRRTREGAMARWLKAKRDRVSNDY